MSDKPKDYGALDLAVSEAIADALSSSPLSLRAAAAAAKMSHNRLGKIARKQTPPASPGEVDRIAQALGTTASAIFAEAESRLGRRSGYALAASDPLHEESGTSGEDRATEEADSP